MMIFHPATEFVCRHCGKDTGYEPEICFYCGPICSTCAEKECPRQKEYKEIVKNVPIGENEK